MSYQGSPQPAYPALARPVITLPFDHQYCAIGGLAANGGRAGSAAWTTGNTAVAIPFQVWQPTVVVKLGWVNGSSAGNNWDIALYNASTNARLTSIGSTAGSGNSAWQWVNTADVTLVPGTAYWLAVNHDTNTANNVTALGSSGLSIGGDLLAGIKVQAVGAVTLPDPFVPADPAAAVNIPLCGMTIDATFV